MIILYLPHRLSLSAGGLITMPICNRVLIGLLGCTGGLFSVSLVTTALVLSGISGTQASASLVTPADPSSGFSMGCAGRGTQTFDNDGSHKYLHVTVGDAFILHGGENKVL